MSVLCLIFIVHLYQFNLLLTHCVVATIVVGVFLAKIQSSLSSSNDGDKHLVVSLSSWLSSIQSCRVQTQPILRVHKHASNKLTIFHCAQSKIVANRSQKALVQLRNFQKKIKKFLLRKSLLLRTKSKYSIYI